MNMGDNELERRAVEELLKEASRGRVRAETMGPAGWIKCPLGSTNKRFLLNTLRPCAVARRSGSRAATARGRDEDRERRHRSEDGERCQKKGREHRGERSRSSSESKRHSSESKSHSPHRSNQSKRTRSRSPVRERSAVKKSGDRTRK